MIREVQSYRVRCDRCHFEPDIEFLYKHDAENWIAGRSTIGDKKDKFETYFHLLGRKILCVECLDKEIENRRVENRKQRDA